MEKKQLTHYFSNYQVVSSQFEEAFYNSKLQYSFRHLAFLENVSSENMMDALQKSMQICDLLEINSKQHFKKVYVFAFK